MQPADQQQRQAHWRLRPVPEQEPHQPEQQPQRASAADTPGGQTPGPAGDSATPGGQTPGTGDSKWIGRLGVGSGQPPGSSGDSAAPGGQAPDWNRARSWQLGLFS